MESAVERVEVVGYGVCTATRTEFQDPVVAVVDTLLVPACGALFLPPLSLSRARVFAYREKRGRRKGGKLAPANSCSETEFMSRATRSTTKCQILRKRSREGELKIHDKKYNDEDRRIPSRRVTMTAMATLGTCSRESSGTNPSKGRSQGLSDDFNSQRRVLSRAIREHKSVLLLRLCRP